MWRAKECHVRIQLSRQRFHRKKAGQFVLAQPFRQGPMVYANDY